MNIIIRVAKNLKKKRIDKESLYNVAYEFMTYHFTLEELKCLKIYVDIKSPFRRDTEPKGRIGIFYLNDEGKYNSFKVILHYKGKYRTRKWIMRNTLRHELIHVLQIIRGDLCYSSDKDICWKGKNCAEMDYYDRPWEKEAFQLANKRYKF